MDKELEIKVTLQEANLILSGLGKLPLEGVIGVFGKVRDQLQKQVAVEKQEENKEN